MYLKHLSLRNFRNFRELELDFPRPLTLLQGPNAQGKTNLLEAIYFLATSRSPQAHMDRQLIHWEAIKEGLLSFAKVAAEVEKHGKTVKLELTIAPANISNGALGFRKQIRVNGVPRRAIELLGEMKVVLFMPQDIDLVAGSPAGRRRYLDVALCQIDRDYCYHLARYHQILPRRNHILRQLQERGGDPEQLTFWDEQLAVHAGPIIATRRRAMAILGAHARHIHSELTDQREELQLTYVPSFSADQDSGPEAITAAYLAQLRESRRQEIAAGMTLRGPHRDDVKFTIGEYGLQEFGSRGQQRTASLALKLAEVELMTAQTGEHPILLLDDVMSELDESRRRYLARLLENAPQAIITTTDLRDYEPAFLERVTLWHVWQGRLVPHEGQRP